MTEPRPQLLLLLPADWQAIPEGLAELRRCLGEEYGASLTLRLSTTSLRSPLPLYVGYWEPGAQRRARWDVEPRIRGAFYSLGWLEEALEDVG